MAVLDPNEIMFTAFEPKVQNRFILYVDGVPAYLIKNATAPGFEAGEIILDHMNVYRKVKGKVRWNDMTLGLYDPVTPSGAQAIMEWARLAHESVTGRDGYSDFYKKDLTLDILGPVGDVVSEWVIKGAYVKTATFGEYDIIAIVEAPDDKTIAAASIAVTSSGSVSKLTTSPLIPVDDLVEALKIAQTISYTPPKK